MKVYHGLKEFKNTKGLVLALGNFDGVHKGHREILNITVQKARLSGAQSAALVFEPHPLNLIKPEKRTLILTPLQEKAALMEQLGIDILLVIPFDQEFASLSPEKFIKRILVQKLQASLVVVGFDYSFGFKGAGRVEDLISSAGNYDFKVEVVKPVVLKNKVVSSSLVRKLVVQGQVEEAAFYLGYPYYLKGQVIPGEGRGKFLGYPTANLEVPSDRIIPADGVYLTLTAYKNHDYYSLTNIGHNPTFKGKIKTIETYIFGFQNSIYKSELRLTFLRKIREERTFPNSEKLKEQIAMDFEKALKIIKSFNHGLADFR
ncbi:bifunctional riboflavin kinase/FAD synthetase [Candidatus Contubernalis alkaliaceticus]|uniref:bifunctional riboflavin kinase/FAD synthetase n=1 Tax=Candidatus Contubernalis alkaliaceticus TaxID=338645 RepID=UPI001F4BE91D|nr:bifunctional riboflavin kinase/FAD synthetase [Candidatus Contubernalis alkalaceticus]UNC91841.1 bifunctional riboflavin kinase/FAD synthetase [Candidatus Contubernalis alkalaceticus]